MPEVLVEGVAVPKDATVSSRPDLFGVRNQFRPDGNGGILSRIQDDRPEYATPEASGIETGFYVGSRGLPWHVALSKQLGTPELMTDAGQLLTTDEALVAAGSFPVELSPAADSETGTIVPGKFVTRRGDTKAPLGVVGRGYKVLQEKELAELANYIVGLGGSIKPVFETGGHLRGGAEFFLSMELQGLEVQVPGDPSVLRKYLLLWTSHDGWKPAGFFTTDVRMVCTNTGNLAREGAFSTFRIRHTGSVDGKVLQARNALGIALKQSEESAAVAKKLALKKVVDKQVMDIFKATWPVEASDTDEAHDKVSRHVERAFNLYGESPNLDGIRGTAWGAYNAVTEYVDHGIKYHGRAVTADDAKADSILFGSAHLSKERALKAALAVGKK